MEPCLRKGLYPILALRGKTRAGIRRPLRGRRDGRGAYYIGNGRLESSPLPLHVLCCGCVEVGWSFPSSSVEERCGETPPGAGAGILDGRITSIGGHPPRGGGGGAGGVPDTVSCAGPFLSCVIASKNSKARSTFPRTTREAQRPKALSFSFRSAHPQGSPSQDSTRPLVIPTVVSARSIASPSSISFPNSSKKRFLIFRRPRPLPPSVPLYYRPNLNKAKRRSVYRVLPY